MEAKPIPVANISTDAAGRTERRPSRSLSRPIKTVRAAEPNSYRRRLTPILSLHLVGASEWADN
jgi:hypothetical protein